MRNEEFTLVVPELTKREASQIKNDIIEMKSKVAPNSQATVAIGKSSNFVSIMERAKKVLGGD